MSKQTAPRTSYYMLSKEEPHYHGETWLEPESLTYPSGGFYRRARVLLENGSLRVVRCSIPDTFFSIPARLTVKGKQQSGFITYSEEHGYRYFPDKA